MKLRFIILSALAIVLFVPSSFGKTFYVNEAVGNDTFDGSSPVVVTDTIGPFQTIVHALDSALDGDTIMVAAGTYREKLVISRKVFILGANFFLSGRIARGAESILQPDTDSIGTGPDLGNTLVTILSDSVIFAGFTLTGDNDTLVSGNQQGSADVDVSYGVYIDGALKNVVVANNIIRDFATNGVRAFGGGLPGSTGNFLVENTIRNIGAACADVRNEAHLDVISNDLDSATTGIHCLGMTGVMTDVLNFNGNNIKASTGILVFNYTSPFVLNVSGNSIAPQTVTGAYGISYQLLSPASNIVTDGNHITNMLSGFRILNPDGATINLNNDTVLSAREWVLWDATALLSDTLNITGMYGSGASGSGIYVSNDNSRTTVSLQDVMAGTAAGGVELVGDVELIPNNTTFSNITNYYIEMGASTSGNVPVVDIDALNVMFNGSTGAGMNDATGMTTEDKILHYMDQSRFAFVDFKSANLFISLVDGNDSLNRALNRVMDGYTIISKGHYFNEVATITNDLVWRSLAMDSIRILAMNGAGKTLNLEGADLNVKDGLAMNNGIINTTLSNMYVGYRLQGEAVNGISGGSTSSYVEGPLYVVNTAQLNGDQIYFPISKDTNYRPVRMHISHLSAGVAYTVRGEVLNMPTSGTVLSPDLTHTSTVRYWSFQVNGFNPIDNIEYEAVYGSSTVTDDVTQPASLRLAAYNSGWVNIGGTGSAPQDGSIRSDSAYFTISNIALANHASGDNRLGIQGVIAKFNWTNNCVSDTFRFTESSTTTGDSIVRYFWDFGDTSLVNDTSVLQNPSWRFGMAGTYTVTLIAEDNLGSTDTIRQDVVVDPLPAVSFTNWIPCFPSNVSFNDASSISSGSNVDWQWTMDSFSASGSSFSWSFPDTGWIDVKLVVTSDKGCVDSLSRSIYYGDSIRISISPLGPINKCIDTVVTLTATTNARFYRWIETNDTAYMTDVVNPGMYTFFGQTGANCFAVDSVEVIDVPSPIVDAGPDTAIWRGTTAFIMTNVTSALPIANFDWTPNDGTLNNPTIKRPEARPDANTVYHIKVTNSVGCVGYDSIFVEVKWPETFVVQNMITPNNDDRNDIWDLSNVPAINDAKVIVLNRWGAEVFSSDNYSDDLNDPTKDVFDGKNDDGTYLPDGTYVYLIVFDEEHLGTLRGNLLIMRSELNLK